MTTFRGFIAVEIEAAPSVIEFENAIAQTGADVKLVEPKNIHLTLKFLGNTDETQIDDIERIIKEAVTDVKPFSVTLKGTGVFPSEKYLKVIWIGILGGETLKMISDYLEEKLADVGFEKERRGFSPHLTIGRVRTAKNKEQLLTLIHQENEQEFLQQEIHALTLKKSELTPKGPIYTTLREIPF